MEPEEERRSDPLTVPVKESVGLCIGALRWGIACDMRGWVLMHSLGLRVLTQDSIR